MRNNDFYYTMVGENPKELGNYLADFFKDSPYHLDVCANFIDSNPGVRITITERSTINKNNYFYLSLLFYVKRDGGETYYKPFGIESDRYTKEDVLAFVLSTLLKNGC